MCVCYDCLFLTYSLKLRQKLLFLSSVACKFCLVGSRDSTALQASELPVRVDTVAADSEVDNIIGAARIKVTSPSGLACITLS